MKSNSFNLIEDSIQVKNTFYKSQYIIRKLLDIKSELLEEISKFDLSLREDEEDY